jgi:hypothetical protein
MSNIPRRSVAPQGSLRRSSSSSGPDLGVKAPVITGRASSSDRQSSFGGRPSSIGRASICNFKTSDGKTITPADLAMDVLKVLQDLDYKAMPVSLKALQLPSTALFYSVFEFFLKHIGIDDVWNADHLPSTASDKKQLPASQPSVQSNVVAQNKLRVELIIFYLEILKFNNVPKPAVLQTMTTPKNWTHMLQIMQFLANDCWVRYAHKIVYIIRVNLCFSFSSKKFLVCYDSHKVLNSFANNFKTNMVKYSSFIINSTL